MSEYLEPQQVRDALVRHGSQVTTVTFAKKDGTITARAGLPKVYKRRVGGEAGKSQAQVLRDNELVFFDYPVLNRKDKKKGFSFSLNRVIKI